MLDHPYVPRHLPLALPTGELQGVNKRAQQLINLDIRVLVRPPDKAMVKLDSTLDGRLVNLCLSTAANPRAHTVTVYSFPVGSSGVQNVELLL